MEPNRPIKSHRDLLVWDRAMELVVSVYALTKSFPKDELYGLTGQIRRAAVSVPANVAEGQGRRLPKEFSQFLANARGSLMELDTHLEIAWRVDYLSEARYAEMKDKIDEVGRMLNGLMRSLATSI